MLHPAAYLRKSSPSVPQTDDFGPFFVRWANFFALAATSGRAGRTFSRTGSCEVATLKPTTPLQPLMQASMKPPSPMLAPKQRPLKPPSPLQPKNAPKTPISHPQRRRRFQLGLGLREQRRRRFHARDLRCRLEVAGPGRAPSQRAEPHISNQAPLVWRAPEGPQGLAAVPVGGGGAWPGFETTRRAQLAARTASGRAAAHGRTKQPGPTSQARRRPEHQRSHKQQAQSRIPAAPPVWRVPEGPEGIRGPGCGGRGRRRGLAGLRDDAPSEARGADGERAGRRPRAHKAARPTGQRVRRPKHQRCHKHHRTEKPQNSS